MPQLYREVRQGLAAGHGVGAGALGDGVPQAVPAPPWKRMKGRMKAEAKSFLSE